MKKIMLLVVVTLLAFIGYSFAQSQGAKSLFVFSAPGFERNMRCSSVAGGQTAPPINTDELKACAHEGHIEYEALAPAAKR